MEDNMAKNGGFPGGMPGNMSNLLKQAQKMQKQMEEQQQELEVTVSGKREVIKVSIDKDAVDLDDIEMLEDLITAAINEALRQVEEANQANMGKLSGGLSF